MGAVPSAVTVIRWQVWNRQRNSSPLGGQAILRGTLTRKLSKPPVPPTRLGTPASLWLWLRPTQADGASSQAWAIIELALTLPASVPLGL